MDRKIFFQGNPLNLVGKEVKIGDLALGFTVISSDLKEVKLTDFNEKVKVITTFPSLDTPVCDLQVKEFNNQAASLSKDIIVIGISKDLPFAQKRFCDFNNIKNVVVLSDYKYSSFGLNYGVLIKELNLLARTALIIDSNNSVRYIQKALEITKALNYKDIIDNLNAVVKSGTKAVQSPKKCMPCEGIGNLLSLDLIRELAVEHSKWEVVDNKKIVRQIQFNSPDDAKLYLDMIFLLAGEQNHHPLITLSYNKLKITLTTHALGGLTENDFLMAGFIDQMLDN